MKAQYEMRSMEGELKLSLYLTLDDIDELKRANYQIGEGNWFVSRLLRKLIWEITENEA